MPVFKCLIAGTLVFCVLAVWRTFRSLGSHWDAQQHILFSVGTHVYFLAIILSYSFNPAMAAAGNVLFRFCFSPMVVTQVIEQINHHMRKGSESQVKCMGLRSVTVWLWFATEILMHFNSASNGFPECPLPSINCSLPSVPPAKWK